MFHPVPTLFGRPEGFRSSSAALWSTMTELHGLCDSLRRDVPQSMAEAHWLLSRLSEHITECFDAEESADYFGTMAEERPDLVPMIADLRTAHDGFRSFMASLRLFAVEEQRGHELAGLIGLFIDAFECHELEELDLLRGFLESDEESRAALGAKRSRALVDAMQVVTDAERALKSVVAELRPLPRAQKVAIGVAVSMAIRTLAMAKTRVAALRESETPQLERRV